jgi:hypothetical protein
MIKYYFLKALFKIVTVYQGQKVHHFRPSLSFRAEAQSRLENRPGQKALFDRGAH